MAAELEVRRVFDRELQRLLHVLPLTVEDHPAEVEAWEADENALGEGLLLLRNGHLFVVKEDKPPARGPGRHRRLGRAGGHRPPAAARQPVPAGRPGPVAVGDRR
jgi:hypothetical protein